ncbi:YetF domain-containing protein [Orrella sp. JC864]|uniref:DUF421 domain-containing protein n=1 Tax=Orrella sp. JC864 TaxID=3120298 RepID=UPI0030096FB5
MDMDWQGIFGLQASPVEMFLRGSVAYCFIFVLLRLAGRRDIGSIGMADLLVLMLVADAAGNAMAGDSTSSTDGLIAVAAIVFWSVVIDRLGYFSPRLHRWLHPERVCLIKHGVLQRKGMRREYITCDELLAELHLQGLERFDQVKYAYMESDGKISILKAQTDQEQESQQPNRRSGPK